MSRSRIYASAVRSRRQSLGNEYFFFDKKKYRLFGEISTKTYQIGDLIQVKVVDVDILSKKILFALAATPE